jgi:alpha-L-rhamnosidase
LALAGCAWVWYPEGSPEQSAPPGTRYFRKQVGIAAPAKIRKATFAGTADNSFDLFVNGKRAGQSDGSAEGWRNPVELDVTSLLHPGPNQLAIAAVNGGDKPNPAGLIGRLVVEFESGPALTERVGKGWKTSKEKLERWTDAGLDDSAWQSAQELVPFGGGPWGSLAANITLSPVKANPFFGHCEIAAAALTHSRICLELEGLAPETAARVTVNGADAGGFIGRPPKLDITRCLKSGLNTLQVEPFAPESARLVVYPKLNN